MSSLHQHIDAIVDRRPATPIAAMRKAALDHADRLADLGPVRVLALDPCPRCDGPVIASTTVARCTRCDYTLGGGVAA